MKKSWDAGNEWALGGDNWRTGDHLCSRRFPPSNLTIWRVYIKKETKGHDQDLVAIGSGGNINKVFSLSKRKDGKPLTLELLKDYHKELSNFTVAERMRLYKFREDRADVIVPALQIYINVMRWANTEEIYVPKIGLVDGLIQHLYEELKRKGKIFSV